MKDWTYLLREGNRVISKSDSAETIYKKWRKYNYDKDCYKYADRHGHIERWDDNLYQYVEIDPDDLI